MAYLRDRRAFGNIGTRKFRGARFGDALSPRFSGLLDQYPGAAAAYSLRRLGSYAGDVVRVRRESDNNERDFTAQEVSNGTLQNWTNVQVTPPLDVRELTATGRDGPIIEAAAAYSLRNLSDSYAGNVVEVRRSSDGALRSFTAAEVTDGTLVTWVNEALNIKTYDFSTNAGGLGNESNLTLTGGQSAGGVDDALKMSVVSTGSNAVHRCYQNLSSLGSGSSLRVTFRAYRPSSNVNSGKLGFSFASGFLSTNVSPQFFSADDVWEDFSFDSNSGTSTRFYVQLSATNGGGSLKSVFNGTTGDHVFIKDLSIDVVSSTGTVSKWYDQSTTSGVPNANHAVQTSAASQPKIVDGGSLVTGGIDFDGVNDTLDLTTTIPASSGSLFTVLNLSTGKALQSLYGNVAGDKLYLPLAQSGNTANQPVIGATIASPFVNGSLATWTTRGDVFSSIVTNTQRLVTMQGVSTTVDVARIGGGGGNEWYVEGTIEELIIYPTDQSDNRTALEANIGEVYGIAGIPAYDNTVNGFVETWYDQSGNGNNATQLTAGSQPKIVDGGALVTGGLDFDGVNDVLETSLVPPNVATLIGVANWDVINATGMIIGARDSDNQRSYISQISTGFTALGLSDSAFAGPSVVAGDDYLLYGSYSGSTRSLSTNGVLLTDESGTAPNNTTQGYSIGAFNNIGTSSGFMNGTIQEVIVYDSDQSDNRLAIEANINNQYDIY